MLTIWLRQATSGARPDYRWLCGARRQACSIDSHVDVLGSANGNTELKRRHECRRGTPGGARHIGIRTTRGTL